MVCGNGFLSTPSSQRATVFLYICYGFTRISIHALFAEGDRGLWQTSKKGGNFYPRPLRRGRPLVIPLTSEIWDFYPRPLRRGRPASMDKGKLTHEISIHALFAEGDDCVKVYTIFSTISIHALFAEGDMPYLCTQSVHFYFYPRPIRRGRPLVRGGYCDQHQPFLSTPSSQRATVRAQKKHLLIKFLSTPSSQRATLRENACRGATGDFYPRPLRRGRRKGRNFTFQ